MKLAGIGVMTLLLSFCGGEKKRNAASDAAATEAGAALPFGAACNVGADCQSSICFQFGNGEKRCSVTCTIADACPEGSQGRKCNNKGHCAP